MDKKVLQSLDKIEDADTATMNMSIDSLTEQFQAYKKRKEQQFKLAHTQDVLSFDKQLTDLREELKNMRYSMERLKIDVEQTVDAKYYDSGDESAEGNKNSASSKKSLKLTCKSTLCLFDRCNRRIDSQLMLIHYLSDHSGACGFRNYHEIAEGERIVLSFEPRFCHFHKNEVLGLLVFGGTVENKVLKVKQSVIYNSFLPEQYEHLESHKPVTVMLCKTSASATIKDKQLAKRVAQSEKHTDQIYVIWLVSPNSEKQMNATLSICGRDPIDTMGTIVAVRHMCHTQNTEKFMPVDQNYWRLTHSDVVKLTNNFRDQLHLEISLAEC